MLSKFKIFLVILACFSFLFSILIYRAYVINQPCEHNIKKLKSSNKLKLNDKSLNTFRNGLKFQTISYQRNEENLTAKVDYIKFIRKEFKDLENYSFVKLEQISLSVLYIIEGSDKNLKPYLLTAHFDVVPADPKNGNWKFDPFSAELDEDFIYARGTLDDKSSMMSQLEAIRIFLKRHGQPKRTIYLAYGHDEEISGYSGAKKISQYLKSKNVSLEFVLDEGTMIIEDLFPDLNKPIALVGIAEKGYMTLKFSVNVTGGHSSMPNAENSALFILSEAITRLKNNKPPSMLRVGPEKDILEKIAVNHGFFKRVLLSNVWLFKPLIEYFFSKSPTLDAMQRTTTAVTIFNGGQKENVMPAYAEFIVNHRIHTLQTCDQILNFDREVINDPRIKIDVLECVQPSLISPTDSNGYLIIEHATMKIHPDVKIIPSIMIALTDSRHFADLTNSVYKYLPIRIKNSDLSRYHGVDERISIKNYEDMINFYFLIFKDTDQIHLNNNQNNHSEL